MVRIPDDLTVESVVDAVILLFAGDGQISSAKKKGVSGEEESAFGALRKGLQKPEIQHTSTTTTRG